MKLKMLVIFLMISGFLPVQGMDEMPEIHSYGNSLNITDSEFDNISSARKFKVHTYVHDLEDEDDKELVFRTEQPRVGFENKQVKKLVIINHFTPNVTVPSVSTMSVPYTVLPFYRNEYWFKFFPMYRHASSFKKYKIEKQPDQAYLDNWQTTSVEAEPIRRSKNLWGWSALVGTAIGTAAALAYTTSYVMKIFNKNK